MTQNIYDDPQFFDAYSRFRRSVQGLDGVAEWPAMRALLPPMAGLRVLDLGCGYGWFCRWSRGAGAGAALGVDVSEKMLERARADTADAAVTYLRADLEALSLPEGGFDLAHSSLALHYVSDLEGLFATVRRALIPGARFVFSIEHPIYMAPAKSGWVTTADGYKAWPLDGYLREGPRSTDWLTEGVIKQHRTLGSTLNSLIQHGFTIPHVDEWGPTPEQIAALPQLADDLERPMFLLVAAERSLAAPRPRRAPFRRIGRRLRQAERSGGVRSSA